MERAAYPTDVVPFSGPSGRRSGSVCSECQESNECFSQQPSVGKCGKSGGAWIGSWGRKAECDQGAFPFSGCGERQWAVYECIGLVQSECARVSCSLCKGEWLTSSDSWFDTVESSIVIDACGSSVSAKSASAVQRELVPICKQHGCQIEQRRR